MTPVTGSPSRHMSFSPFFRSFRFLSAQAVARTPLVSGRTALAALEQQKLVNSLPSSWAQNKKSVEFEDLLSHQDYAKIRKQMALLRRPLLQQRRLKIGDDMSFLFTSYDSIWFQIHEMLHIEKGEREQAEEEIEAYQSLIPTGGNIVGSLMIEINNIARRDRMLSKLVGVENSLSISFDGYVVVGKPVKEEEGDGRTKSGKTSAVHFIDFTFNNEQKSVFKNTTAPIFFTVGMSVYAEMSEFPPELRKSLQNQIEL